MGFGYKKVKVEQEKNWMMEVKGGAPDEEDPYEKEAEVKREKIAKNELQRLRNLAKARKVNVPTAGVLPTTQKTEVKGVTQSEDLRKAAEIVKTSTASLGKFESNTGDVEQEKSRTLRVLESITNKSARLDIDAAVNKQIFREDQERRTEKEKERDSKSKKKKSGKGERDKAHFRNKGGKGKFTGKNRSKGKSVGRNSKK